MEPHAARANEGYGWAFNKVAPMMSAEREREHVVTNTSGKMYSSLLIYVFADQNLLEIKNKSYSIKENSTIYTSVNI